MREEGVVPCRHRPFMISCHKNIKQSVEFLEQQNPGQKSNNTQNNDKKRYAIAIKALRKKLARTETPQVEVESVYKVLPKAEKYVPKSEIPVPRFIWKEQDWPEGFPSSPEEANVDIFTYLEQRDCYRRLKKMQFKEFCVGSFVEVTYADQYATGGYNRSIKLTVHHFMGNFFGTESVVLYNVKHSVLFFFRFRGICIYKGHWQNSLGASFTLRNVIDNEPLEINFQLYSPLIQELKVLKHQRFKEHQLKYLRDYPPAFSYVSEKMKEQPYTEEPELFEFNEENRKKIDRWFSRFNQRKL